MKKKFLTKKVIASLLAGGMLYSGGVLLPDAAFDEAVKLVPDMVSVASADDVVNKYGEGGNMPNPLTSSVVIDLSTRTDGGNTVTDTIVGQINANSDVSIVLQGLPTSPSVYNMPYSITGGASLTILSPGVEIGTVSAATVALNPKVYVGSDERTTSVTLSANAGSLLNGVTVRNNSTLKLIGGNFRGNLELGTTASEVSGTTYKSNVEITGNVDFKTLNGNIKLLQSAAGGTDDDYNFKRLVVDTGATLSIGAGNVIFDNGYNFDNNSWTGNNKFINKGIVNFYAGTLDNDILISGTGVVNIMEDVTMGAGQVVSTGGITIKNEGKKLNLTSGTLSVNIGTDTDKLGEVNVAAGKEITTSSGTNVGIYSKIVNAGKFSMTNGTHFLKNDLVNSGEFTLQGNYQLSSVSTAANLNNSGTFKQLGDIFTIEKVNIDNAAGSVEIAGSYSGEENFINNKGAFTIDKSVNAKTITNEGTFTAKDVVNANVENKENGVMEVQGALNTTTITNTVNNSGQLTTKGEVNGIVNNLSTGTMHAEGTLSTIVKNEGELFVTAEHIGAGLNNSGTVHLGAGELTKDISGVDGSNGILLVEGEVNNNNSVITQKSLTIENSGKLTTDFDSLNIDDDFITNNKELVINQDGILTKDIKGNGITTLDSGKTLSVGTNHEIEGTLSSSGIIDMQETNIAEGVCNTLTIGKLTGSVDLKIDIDMSSLTSDKLTIGNGSAATVNLKNINIIKDYVPKEEDYGTTDEFEVKAPVVVDGITGDDAKAKNAITFVDGDGAGSANYTISDDAKNPAYSSTPTDTHVVTNNYKYTFGLGNNKGKLNFKVESADVTFENFIKGTLPGYDGTEDPLQDIDPKILCLTGNMVMNDSTVGQDNPVSIGSATQKNSELSVNLNGHELKNTSGNEVKVQITDGKTLNIDGGSETTSGVISEKITFDVQTGGALKFSGNTEVNDKITNAATGDGKGVINDGKLVLKGEVVNSGLFTNEDGGLVDVQNNVTGSGTFKNLSDGIMQSDTKIPGLSVQDKVFENDLVNEGHAYFYGDTADNMQGRIDNSGMIEFDNAGVLSSGSEKTVINNEDGKIYFHSGILNREITKNDGVIYFSDGEIKVGIGQSEGTPGVLNKVLVITKNVEFNGTDKVIKNNVYVGIGTDAEEKGNFTMTNGTVTGDVHILDESTANNNDSGLITGTVYNEGTMATNAAGVAHGEKGVYNSGKLTLKGSGDNGKLASDILFDSSANGDDYLAKTIVDESAKVDNSIDATNHTGGWTITQKELEVQGELKTDVDFVHIRSEADGQDNGIIKNDGTITFTADGIGNNQYTDTSIKDTLHESIESSNDTNYGIVLFGTGDESGDCENKFTVLGDITQKSVDVNLDVEMFGLLKTMEGTDDDSNDYNTDIKDGKYLQIAAYNLKSDITTSNGITKLTAGEYEGQDAITNNVLQAGFTITGGKIEVLNHVTVEDVNDLKSDKGIENKESILTICGTGSIIDNIAGTDATHYGAVVIGKKNTQNAEITLPQGKEIKNSVQIKGGDNSGSKFVNLGKVTGSVYIDKNAEFDSSDANSEIINGEITEGIVEFTDIENGRIINNGKLTANVENIKGFAQVFNRGLLTLLDSTTQGLKYDIVQGGNSSSGTTIIKGVVNNKESGESGGKTISQQSLVIEENGKLITNADNLNISSKKITNYKDLVLIGGTLNADVAGAGTTTIGEDANNPADVTVNGKLGQASLIQKDSVLHIDASNLAADVTNNEGTVVLGKGTLNVKISSADGKTGNVEYMGDINVNKAPENVYNMKIGSGKKVDFSKAGNQAVKVENSFELGDNSTLVVSAPPVQKVESSTALDRTKAAIEITGLEGTFTAEGKNGILKIAGNKLDENGCYVIVGGASVDGTLQPWSTILTDDFGVELVYTSDPRAFGTTTNGVVAVKALPAATIAKVPFCDAPTVFNTMKENLPVESTERKFLRDANFAYKGDAKKGLDAWNSMTSLGAVAGATQNAVTSINLTMDVMEDHLSVVNIPSGYVGKGHSNRPILMDTVSDMRNMLPEIIPGGETSSVMPQRFESNNRSRTVKQVKGGGGGHRISGSVDPENQIWASYIHSKETVDGLKAGNATNDSDVKYNGVSVGLDLWSGQKCIGGVYGSYVEGEVDGRNSAATTRNEIDNYSVGIYNRLDYGFGSILVDAGYTHSKNDITQKNLGYEITAKPKVEAYSAGLRYEKLCEAGRSILTPFFGVRYMNVQSKAYENNFGVHYKVEDQDLITIPVGFKWYAEMNPDSKTRFRPSLEAGYNFNINCKNNKQKVTFDGVTDTVKFNAADEWTYYVKVGMEFVSSNTVLGLFYKYTKGDHIKDSQFNVNLAFDF